MPKPLFTNNATGTLSASILAGDLSFTTVAGGGAKFPSPASGDYMWVTLQAPTGGATEIVKVTARAGEAFTVAARGQQGTAAAGWPAGTLVELRSTAQVFTDLFNTLTPTGTGMFFNVKDYGAVGDGSTNDAAAVQACITAAKAVGASVYFPSGQYLITGLAAQNGLVVLIGNRDATLIGNFVYNETAFPRSADVIPSLLPTAPFFAAFGINFKTNNTTWALQVIAQDQGSFITTTSIRDCKFYGYSGALFQRLVGFDVVNCEFDTSTSGVRLETCINGTFDNCRWQNIAAIAVEITSNAATSRTGWVGGEGVRFISCEWMVCSLGLVCNSNAWTTVDSCLLDYCGLPLYLQGSAYFKSSDTYYGVSGTAAARLSGVAGYQAPVVTGIAVYGTPNAGQTLAVGASFDTCEFITYMASTQPLVYFDGGASNLLQNISLISCLLYATTTHTMPRMMELSRGSVGRVIANTFKSANLSTTSMDSAYRMNAMTSYNCHSNDFSQCTQSSVALTSAAEKLLAGVIVSSSDPGAVGPGAIWVVP